MNQKYLKFKEFLKEIKEEYNIYIDEMYSFINGKYNNKRNKNLKKQRINKRYIFTFIVELKRNKQRYYDYHIANNTSSALFDVINNYFNYSSIQTVFCDGNIAYNKYFGNKATCQKSFQTNIIENLNSQIRDKLYGFVRKTKAHYKKQDSMEFDLNFFFNNKNVF